MSPVTRRSERTRAPVKTTGNITAKEPASKRGMKIEQEELSVRQGSSKNESGLELPIKIEVEELPVHHGFSKNESEMELWIKNESDLKLPMKIELEEPSVQQESSVHQESLMNESKSKVKTVTVRSTDGNFDVIRIPEHPDIKIKVVRPGKFPYTCSKCSVGFWTKKAFDAHAPVHVLRKLKPPVKKFRCDVCAKEFSKLCDIDRHMRVHTGEKPCICNICNKGFQQSHNLSKHLLTHLHIRPFHCEICDKQFGRGDVLARHVLTHSIDKPIKCWVCYKGFIRQTQLVQHHQKYHRDQPLVKPEPEEDDAAEEAA